METEQTNKFYLYLVIGVTLLLSISIAGVGYYLTLNKKSELSNFLLENEIGILKAEGCAWCEKQLREFSKSELETLNKDEKIIECMNEEVGWICGTVGTPSWWTLNSSNNRVILHEGYIPREDIILVLQTQLNLIKEE